VKGKGSIYVHIAEVAAARKVTGAYDGIGKETPEILAK
jgi:hypothetical protein